MFPGPCSRSATRLLAPAALAAVAAGRSADRRSAARSREPPSPNIVMVMLDDADPHDGRLWSADTMPALNELIVSQGIRFTDFHGEVPLCGPSRANLLTGQHAHNSGANSNNGAAARRLDHHRHGAAQAGYHTAYVGKYLNGYRKFSPDRLDPPGWSEFDVINSNQGKYFWYQIRDREGDITQHHTARGGLLHRRHRRHRRAAHPRGARRPAALRHHLAVHAARTEPPGPAPRRRPRAAGTSSPGRRPTTTRPTSPTSRPTSRRPPARGRWLRPHRPLREPALGR